MRNNAPGDVRITRTVVIPRASFKFRFARSSGPGGQNVNKVASKVELLFDPALVPDIPSGIRGRITSGLAGRLDRRGLLHVVVDQSRSQWANREEAIARLIEFLRDAIRERLPRKETAPTAGSRQRRSFTKEKRSKIKKLRRSVSLDE